MNRDPAEEVEAATIHLLYQGKALCQFSLGFPSDWPPGHRGTDRPAQASCEGCLGLYEDFFKDDY